MKTAFDTLTPSRRARATSRLVAGLAIVFLTAGVAAASGPAIGPDGSVLEVRNGLYGSLFPQGAATSSDASVLALDVRTADGTSSRLLVPGSENFYAEDSVSLIFEDGAGVAYVLWEGLSFGVHPLLYLTTFDGTGWGEVVEISGSPFSHKGQPQLFVTHEAPRGSAGIDRAVVHVTWWEETFGAVRKRYTALVLEDGLLAVAGPLRDLSRYVETVDGPLPGSTTFDRALRMVPGQDAGSVVVGFADPDGNKLATVEMAMLPQELSRLASAVAITVQSFDETATREDVAAAVHLNLVEAGADFHPAALAYLSQQVVDLVLDGDADSALDLLTLSWKLASRIIHVGMKVGDGGVANPDASEVVWMHGAVPHHLRVSSLASWQIPDVPAAESTHFFVSRDGGDALVAWTAGQRIGYLETVADGHAESGWSAVRWLDLDDRLSEAEALSALERRTLDR